MIVAVWWFALVISALAKSQVVTNNRDARQRHSSTTHPSSSETTAPTQRSPCGDIEYRLTRLEILLVEKLESLRTEIRETSRRLQSLEWQSVESQSALETLRTDINRMSQQISAVPSRLSNPPEQRVNPPLEQRVDNLAKGVQILIVATRGLTSDVNHLRRNVSTLINDSREVLKLAPALVTKQFFNNGLLELKHQQTYRPWSEPQSTCPNNPQPKLTDALPKNCKDVQNAGHKRSGIYRIQPEHSSKSFMVVCDLQTSNGGWTVIQNRYDGSQDFYQNWHDYKYGFGNLGGEFWLGLENLHQLTGYDVNELLIELEDMDLQSKNAFYRVFSVGSEVEGYPLKVLGGYGGTAGDSLLYHAGSRFSTKDMDQDGWPEGSCAQAHGGAWWYRSCDTSNLNGRYLSGALPEQYIYQGMYWGEFRGAQYSLLKSRMLVRPREQISPLVLDEIFDANMSLPKMERGVRDALKSKIKDNQR